MRNPTRCDMLGITHCRVWDGNKGFDRASGPALEYDNGGKRWYVQGKLHRIDGPAKEDIDVYPSWYVNGLFLYYETEDVVMARRIRDEFVKAIASPDAKQEVQGDRLEGSFPRSPFGP